MPSANERRSFWRSKHAGGLIFTRNQERPPVPWQSSERKYTEQDDKTDFQAGIPNGFHTDSIMTGACAISRKWADNEKALKSQWFQGFLHGGDKRDRTADLMTASCDRFVVLSVFVSNVSVLSAKSAGFCKVLSIASTRVRAHLGRSLGQGSWANSGDSKRSRHGL